MVFLHEWKGVQVTGGIRLDVQKTVVQMALSWDLVLRSSSGSVDSRSIMFFLPEWTSMLNTGGRIC